MSVAPAHPEGTGKPGPEPEGARPNQRHSESWAVAPAASPTTWGAGSVHPRGARLKLIPSTLPSQFYLESLAFKAQLSRKMTLSSRHLSHCARDPFCQVTVLFPTVQMSHNATVLGSTFFRVADHNKSPLEAVYVSNTLGEKEKSSVLCKMRA